MTQDVLNEAVIIDLLLRVKSLESLLIDNSIIDKTKYQEEVNALAKKISKFILEKANVSQETSDLLSSLNK
jgi:hypothetical protein